MFKRRIPCHVISFCAYPAPEPSISTSKAWPETPTLNETTLLENAEEGFALEPVAVTRMSLIQECNNLVYSGRYLGSSLTLIRQHYLCAPSLQFRPYSEY